MNDSTIYNYLSQSQVHSIRKFAKKTKQFQWQILTCTVSRIGTPPHTFSVKNIYKNSLWNLRKLAITWPGNLTFFFRTLPPFWKLSDKMKIKNKVDQPLLILFIGGFLFPWPIKFKKKLPWVCIHQHFPFGFRGGNTNLIEELFCSFYKTYFLRPILYCTLRCSHFPSKFLCVSY
jgi:hypothetical protein